MTMTNDLKSRVFNYILDSKGGETELSDLIQSQSPLKGFTEARALEVLNSSRQEDSELSNQQKINFVVEVNSGGRRTVRIPCKARICAGYDRNGRCVKGKKCKNLHVCRKFLENNCPGSIICSRSHNLLDEHNKSNLRTNDRILTKPNSKVQKLISRNLPRVCKEYLSHKCSNEYCQNLHLCSRFVRDVCCFEENHCPFRLSHDLNSSHNKKIYKKYQVPENSLKCNTLLPQGIRIESDGGAVGEAERNKASFNNLDTDEAEKHLTMASKLMYFPQNVSLYNKGCPCSAATEDRQEEHGQSCDVARPRPLHVEKQNLQKWSSISCFLTLPSSSATQSLDYQGSVFRPCSVPYGLDGRSMVEIARDLPDSSRVKPVNWAGRGRGRTPSNTLSTPENPAPGLQPNCSKKLNDYESSTSTEVTNRIKLPAVFNRILTKFNGTAKFSGISYRTDPVFCFSSVEEKEKWFREHKSSFLLIEDAQGNIKEVKTISSRAKMCPNYLGRSANCGSKRCPYFRVCKDYIANGKCSQPAPCCRNHGFHDKHNKKLASELFPDVVFSDEQLRQLIKSSTPQVCLYYNKRTCCGEGLQCKKIHVCKNYVSGKCNSRCGLLHESGLTSAETRKLLACLNEQAANAKGLLWKLLICEFEDTPQYEDVDDPENVTVNFDVVNDDDDEESDVADGDNTSSPTEIYKINSSSIGNHICMKFLLKECMKELCTDHHCLMPYQWVYMAKNKWHMLNEDENTELEGFFCQKEVLVNLTKFSVDFTRMEITEANGMKSPIKRLSTESEVHIPDCQLTTKWQWFWKDLSGKFNEYQPSQMDSSSSTQQKSKFPKSDAIEKCYLEGHSTYDFDMDEEKQRIYFRDTPMCQRAVGSNRNTKQDVIRRPKFVSREEFEVIKSKPIVFPGDDTRELPSTWTKMAECQGHLLVQLFCDSSEYQEIESMFSSNMRDKGVTVSSIDRIQNPFLWEKYTRKKNYMRMSAATNKPQDVTDERLLFHSTSHKNLRRICKQNLDWRSYGYGAPNIYGEGVYFSKDPSLSHWLCPENEDGFRYMFIFSVLVGSYTEGKKSYRHPPPRDPLDPNSEMFDSCVDRIKDPEVYVVFDVDQYYPGYVIEYRTKDNLASELETCSIQ